MRDSANPRATFQLKEIHKDPLNWSYTFSLGECKQCCSSEENLGAIWQHALRDNDSKYVKFSRAGKFLNHWGPVTEGEYGTMTHPSASWLMVWALALTHLPAMTCCQRPKLMGSPD
jgi:hypothetical protein